MKQYKCPNCWTKNSENAYSCSNCWEVFRTNKNAYNEYIEKDNIKTKIKIQDKSITEKQKKRNINRADKAKKVITNTWKFSAWVWIFKIIAWSISLSIFWNPEYASILARTINVWYFEIFLTILVWIIYLILGNRIREYHNKKIIRSLIIVMIISISSWLITLITNTNNSIWIILSIRLGILCIRSLSRIKYTDKNKI